MPRICRRATDSAARAAGSIIPSTAKGFLTGTRERRRNSTESVATTRLSHERRFADGPIRDDKIWRAVEPGIAAVLAARAGQAIAALWETVEAQVIAPVQASSAAVTVREPGIVAGRGNLAAVRELAAALLKALTAAAARRAAPASVAAPAVEASAAAAPGPVVADSAAEEEAVEEAAGAGKHGLKNGMLEKGMLE
jgi:hypothetical protein